MLDSWRDGLVLMTGRGGTGDRECLRINVWADGWWRIRRYELEQRMRWEGMTASWYDHLSDLAAGYALVIKCVMDMTRVTRRDFVGG